MTFDSMLVMSTPQQLIRLPIMTSTAANGYHNTYLTQADIDSDVRRFWGAFPCPPPWRPSLLSEVNTSKLGPRIGESVKNFLVGKCQLQPPAVVHHHASWCDKTCQLAIGCSGLFVATVIVVLIVMCLNRSRNSHKMPSTRPSRQQLQMSTSTSDPVNWAEFSNAQVQFDDDIIYPPFRHRDLPSPPSQCHHPSCDPKWTCQNSFSFHPMMRMSPSSTTYCTQGYTAVYEKIDDEEEDVDETGNCRHARSLGPGERTANIQNNHRTFSSCVPYLPDPQGTTRRQREEETGFNGDNLPVSVLPRYFELEGTHPNSNTNNSLEDQINDPNVSWENDSSWNNRNKFCFNSFQVHSAFLNNPNVCNQLCATCVASVVSNAPPPCLNTHGQNGCVPNVSTFNVHPSTSTVNSVSSNPPDYQPSNGNSFRQNSQKSAFSPCFKDSIPENDPPPYNEQGCELRYRNSFKPDGDECQCPDESDHCRTLPNNLICAESDSMALNGDHACHVTQPSSPFGSPCRQWCPQCQQVPLLYGEDTPNHHSASFRPQTLSMPWHNANFIHTLSSVDGRIRENERDEGEVNLNLEGADGNACPPSQSVRKNQTEQNMKKENENGSNGEAAVWRIQQDGHDRSQDETCENNMPKPILSLHSDYFNKTSSA